jgi:hypothetical protein
MPMPGNTEGKDTQAPPSIRRELLRVAVLLLLWVAALIVMWFLLWCLYEKWLYEAMKLPHPPG